MLEELLDLGILYNACSLRQLRAYGALRKGDRTEQLGVRFNPGLGSGGTGKTNVGGPSSSFGIWHELLPEVQAIVAEFLPGCEVRVNERRFVNLNREYDGAVSDELCADVRRLFGREAIVQHPGPHVQGEEPRFPFAVCQPPGRG